MLIALSIRNFVLVRALDLELEAGFTALTGETGAGKSIILSALGFALGAKTGKGAIRAGADTASVTATFDPPDDHPVRRLLQDNDIEIDADEPLVLRRVMRTSGAARGYLNDAPLSARLMQQIGEHLLEVHGQHAGHALLHTSAHRRMIDGFADAAAEIADYSDAWSQWRLAMEARQAVEARLARAETERAFLEHAVSELEALAPEDGEAEALAQSRAELQSFEKVALAVDDALKSFDKSGPEQALASASRALSRAMSIPVVAQSPEDSPLRAGLVMACEALERALIEAGEAYESVSRLRSGSEYSPEALEHQEARLFALRAAARKYDTDPDQLGSVHARMRMQLDEIVHSDQALQKAMDAEKQALAAYNAAADALTKKRQAAGEKLSKAVARELKPLKLEKAKFRVLVADLPLEEAGPNGKDRVAFEVQTNPGADFGALDKIASGGELARFSLALKVCLAGQGQAGVLIFDEADVGVGGAIAAAIGERMLELSKSRQVLAITHSPQVAAAADHQLRISKGEKPKSGVETKIAHLAAGDRLEEIARMLAGAQVTKEARAAADSLLARP